MQLQLSEVIMRARQYMSEVVGGEGAVLTHHAKKGDFKKKFEEAQIKDEAPVQKFLDKIQSDDAGYGNVCNILFLQNSTLLYVVL